MSFESNPNLPTLPLSDDSAKRLGVQVANEFAIRTLINQLGREGGKRKFEDELVCAKKNPQEFLMQELRRLYHLNWPSEATNANSPSYPTLRASFVCRISSILDTFYSLRP